MATTLRIVAACLCLLLCVGGGTALSHDLRLRVALLESLCKDLGSLRGWASYRALPLGEMFSRLQGSSIYIFWDQVAERMKKSERLENAWNESLKVLRQTRFAALRAGEFSLLEELGKELCKAREPEQLLSLLDASMEGLRRFVEEARAELLKKGKLYNSIGILGGLALALAIL